MSEIEDLKKFRSTPRQQMISACTGTILTSLTMTPFDVVKVRLQSQQKAILSNKCFLFGDTLMNQNSPINGYSNIYAKKTFPINGSIGILRHIMKNEGVFTLWSGLTPTLIIAIPATMTYLVLYEQLRLILHDKYIVRTGDSSQPIWIPIVSSVISRTSAVTLVSPLELIRTKMQSKKLSFQEVSIAIRSLIKFRGISGFWMGWVPTLMRDVTFSVIYWSCYEGMKRAAGQLEPTVSFSFSAGAVSGMIAGTLTLPFDVVKTHRQIQLGEADLPVLGKTLATTKSIMTRIYNNQGIRGLFKGYVPRVLKVAPACGIMISTYEYGKSFFVNYNKQHSVLQ